jgi:hypothetical protein
MLLRSQPQSNSFAKSDISELLPLSDHDAILIGDTLSTLALNYQWRLFVIGILTEQLEKTLNDATDDNEWNAVNKVLVMIADWYT